MENPNKNNGLIDGLRQFADFLESKPDMPALSNNFNHFVYDKKALLSLIQHLGSFKKSWDDYSLRVERSFGSLKFIVAVSRDQICTKRIVWDCPDQALMELVSNEKELEEL